MLSTWNAITAAADPWLDTLDGATLGLPYRRKDGRSGARVVGNLLQRVIYHYWYHLGENMALRKMLGHESTPQFVGDIDGRAPYALEGSPGGSATGSS